MAERAAVTGTSRGATKAATAEAVTTNAAPTKATTKAATAEASAKRSASKRSAATKATTRTATKGSATTRAAMTKAAATKATTRTATKGSATTRAATTKAATKARTRATTTKAATPGARGRRVARLEPSRDLTHAELRALGRSRRKQASRRSHGRWVPSPQRPDPVELLIESNRSRLPTLAPIRIGRMVADPFAFLRGSAVVMAHDLATTPTSGIHVQACGDAHLLNLGVFATPERHLVFDLNDFDETLPGPWEWDVKRLAASFVVSARVAGMPADVGPDVARAVARSYRTQLAVAAEHTNLERWYARLDVDHILATLTGAVDGDPDRERILARATRAIDKARHRDSLHALDRFTDVVDGQRVIVPAPPLIQRLEDDHQRHRLHAFFNRYRESLPDDRRFLLDQYHFVDAALKVVGVGSVGTRAFIVLLASRAALDPLFLQIKEAQASVLAPFVGRSAYANEGRRVVEGQRLLQAASDVFLGWGESEGRHYYVRQLRDMKGSADPTTMRPATLAAYAELCGHALARAHACTVHPALLTGYLGAGDAHDGAIARFAVAYADQTERDHERLVQAVRMGRLPAIQGI